MATIRKVTSTKKGTGYRIWAFVGEDKTGKKIQKTITYYPEAKTPRKIEQEVNAFAKKFEEEIQNGGMVTNEKMTFSEAVEKWGKWAFSRVSETVKENYEDIIKRYLSPRYGALKVAKITPLHCQKLVDDLAEKGLSLSTITKIKNVFHSIMEYCYKLEIIDRNPVDRVILPKIKQEPGKIQFFTEDQARRFLAALDEQTTYKTPEHTRIVNGKAYTVQAYNAAKQVNYQWKLFFHIAIMGGFRRGEMLALTWRDIDMENGFISIDKAIAKTRNGQKVKDPKTRAGNRLVAMPSEIFVMLDTWKTEMIQIRERLGAYWKGQALDNFADQFVFIQYNGEMMNLDTPSHKLKEIIQAYNKTAPDPLKLPEIRLHDLRHTNATILIANNVDVETIAQRLGHSQVNITLNRYGHALPSRDLVAAQALGRVFG